MKVICVGTHPDDMEIGVGGTIVNHIKNNDDMYLILCTLGGVSGPPDVRKKEAQRAAKILGVKNLEILDYSVFKLNKPTNEFYKILAKIVDKVKPDRVYTHSPFDFHQVHVTVSNSTVKATKNVKQVLFYETISSTTTEFKPDAFVDITKSINQKIQSLKAHKTQSHRFYVQPNVIKSLANTRYVWGKVGMNSKGYAEAFMTHRFVF